MYCVHNLWLHNLYIAVSHVMDSMNRQTKFIFSLLIQNALSCGLLMKPVDKSYAKFHYVFLFLYSLVPVTQHLQKFSIPKSKWL